MSFKNRLAKVLLCLTLEIGALCGVPIRADEIEKLMRLTNGAVKRLVQEKEGDKDPNFSKR